MIYSFHQLFYDLLLFVDEIFRFVGLMVLLLLRRWRCWCSINAGSGTGFFGAFFLFVCYTSFTYSKDFTTNSVIICEIFLYLILSFVFAPNQLVKK